MGPPAMTFAKVVPIARRLFFSNGNKNNTSFQNVFILQYLIYTYFIHNIYYNMTYDV